MKTDNKTGILYREWRSPSPKRAVLLVHGLGGHSARWTFLADFLLGRGFSSYAIELRGFGETKEIRGHIDSFSVYFRDIRRLRSIIAEEQSRIPIFLVGESTGALISFLMAGSSPGLFNGLICISPFFAAGIKISTFDYMRTFLPLLYNPRKLLAIPFTSAMCTRDTAYQKIMDEDPRELRVATSKFLFNTITAQLCCRVCTKTLRLPVLFLLAGEDRLVDAEASERVLRRLNAEDKSIICYPKMYHALSIDLDREVVFEDMFKWMKERQG